MADQRPDGAIAARLARSDSRNHRRHDAGLLRLHRLGRRHRHHALGALSPLWRPRRSSRRRFAAMVRWNDFVWSISNGPIVHPPSALGRPRLHLRRLAAAAGRLRQAATRPSATTPRRRSISTSPRPHRAGGARSSARPTTPSACSERAEEVKAAFQNEFITASGRLGYNDQTSYALAFLHDLIPPEHVEAAKGYFKATIERADGRIGTGFIGTPGAAAGADQDRRAGTGRRGLPSGGSRRAGSTR